MPRGTARHRQLASFQHEATKALTALHKEITHRERGLSGLKREAARWQSVLQAPARGDGASTVAIRRRPRRKWSRLDWDAIFKELPTRFTIKDIAEKAGKPTAHIYAHLSGWMKQNKVQRVKKGYKKAPQAA